MVVPLPDELMSGPFPRQRALDLGISARVLEGRRFVRVHHAVYRHRDHVMTFDDEIRAARLALPAGAHPTGATRLRLAGLSFGPSFPLRFVVEGDLHLTLERVFLHRTVLLPPVDDVGVTIPAAFVALCARATTIHAISVGDCLLSRRLMTVDDLGAVAAGAEWRAGAREALWVGRNLDARSRSPQESALRAMVAFSGLPAPEPNAPVLDDAGPHADLWFPEFRTAVEYEGAQHQVDRPQYVADVDRYRLYRDHDVRYLLVTKESLATPKTVVRRIHAQLVKGGYEGPPPDFGADWDLLMGRLSGAVPRRRAPERCASHRSDGEDCG
jgi:hypothetical protein